MIRVLFIGLGSIAKRHIIALKSIEAEAEIFALRSSLESNHVEGINSIYDISEIPNDLSFAVISNPTFLHKESILKMLSFNIPLLIEKPLANTLNDAHFINDNNKTSNIISLISCNLRFHPCIQYLKQHLSNIDWIEINASCGSYLPDWRPSYDYKENYSAHREQGGGVDLDLIHELDYLFYLIGGPNKIHSHKKNLSSLGINSPDYAHYLLEYDQGIVTVALNYYRKTPKRTIEIITNNDVLIVDLLKYSIFSETEGKMIYSEKIERNELLKRQLSYFLECIKNNQNTMNPIREAYEVLKICLNEESK